MKKTQMIGYNYDDKRRMTAKMSEIKARGGNKTGNNN